MSDRPPTFVNRERSDRISGPHSPDSSDPRLAFRWSNYEAVKKLGEGAMGAVYELRHRAWPARRLAVKFLHPTPDLEIVARFRQEAAVAAQIPSHRIVKSLDEGALPDGTLYYIMELVEGRSLADQIAAGPLSVKDTVQIGARIAETMSDVHTAKVVHRDLKPPNIFLTTEGSRDRLVKILDFGVAKVGGELRQVGTQVGKSIGTPGYMAPEANGGDTDYRTDVYSLGVILFEMLTGKLPIPVYPNFIDTVQALMNVAPPSVRAVRPSHLDPVPPELDVLILRMLAKYPTDRPQDMTEVLTALDRIYEGIKQAAAASGVPHRMPTQLSTTVPPPDAGKKFTKADPSTIEGVLDRLGAPRPQIPTAAEAPHARALASDISPAPRRRTGRIALVAGGVALASALLIVGIVGIARTEAPASTPPPVAPPRVVAPAPSTPIAAPDTSHAIAPAQPTATNESKPVEPKRHRTTKPKASTPAPAKQPAKPHNAMPDFDKE